MPTNETNPTPNPASDFDWKVDEETGGVKITGVRNKTATRIVVPEEIDGRPVTAFQFGNYREHCDCLQCYYREHCDYLQSLVLNSRCASLTFGELECFNSLRVLTEIIVPPNHPKVCSVDGVLFSADGKMLWAYPAGKTDEEYVVPDGVEEIWNIAFRRNPFLKSLTFPASWKGVKGDFDRGKLVGGPALTEFRVAPRNPNYYAVDGVLFAGGENGMRGLYAYPPGKKERTYAIPDNVDYLECAAFNKCVHLRLVSFPEKEEFIDACCNGCNAFEGCDRRLKFKGKGARSFAERFAGRMEKYCVESVMTEDSRGDNWKKGKRPPRVVWMNDRDGNYVLQKFNDERATSFSVPERYEGRRVTRIGARAFANCGRLREVTLPETMRVIEKEAFWGCESLRSITFGGKELQIGAGAFAECESLAKITLPETLRVVEEKTFWECKSLRSATFGSQLREISWDAFYLCSSLTSATLPDSAPDKIRRVFQGKKLRLTPTASPRLRLIDDVLFTADGKTLLSCPRDKSGEYVVPDGVEVIGDSAFDGCTSLTSVTLPAGLQTIDGVAFYGCDLLTSVTFPVGLQTIGSHAFFRCQLLTSVTLPAGLQTLGNEAFSYCGADLTLYAPAGSVAEEYARKNGLRFEAVDAETGTSDADDGE